MYCEWFLGSRQDRQVSSPGHRWRNPTGVVLPHCWRNTRWKGWFRRYNLIQCKMWNPEVENITRMWERNLGGSFKTSVIGSILPRSVPNWITKLTRNPPRLVLILTVWLSHKTRFHVNVEIYIFFLYWWNRNVLMRVRVVWLHHASWNS